MPVVRSTVVAPVALLESVAPELLVVPNGLGLLGVALVVAVLDVSLLVVVPDGLGLLGVPLVVAVLGVSLLVVELGLLDELLGSVLLLEPVELLPLVVPVAVVSLPLVPGVPSRV